MTIDLNQLVIPVRGTLSDVPADYLTDDQLYDEVDKAYVFCNKVIESGTSESYISKCIVTLAAYYAYINYTSLSERQLGTLPPTSAIRLKALKGVAASFLQLVSIYPLTDDLTIDKDRITNPAGITLTYSVLDD
jgi:hypothetical protein